MENRKAEEIDAYVCPMCEGLHDTRLGADGCCDMAIRKTRAFACPECRKLYDQDWEAEDCCRQYPFPADTEGEE